MKSPNVFWQRLKGSLLFPGLLAISINFAIVVSIVFIYRSISTNKQIKKEYNLDANREAPLKKTKAG